ncbi:MAG: hypothetical protein ABI670_09305 [Chloroflexota bacterium]
MEKHHTEENEETITITIGKNAALVLDNLLGRWQMNGLNFTLQIEDDAEWHALSVVLTNLEIELAEPFMPDYLERVQLAQRKLIEQWGEVEK